MTGSGAVHRGGGGHTTRFPARVAVEQHQADAERLLAPLRTGRCANMVPLDAAVGRVTATAINASVNLPPFHNSQMDGYAVRAQDVATAGPGHPIRLDVVADIPAGHLAPVRITPGQAARIMTGAPIPDGANAVVPVEETAAGTFPDQVWRNHPVEILTACMPGDFVRRTGSDVAVGDQIIECGTRLRPHHIAALAATGLPQVSVVARPRVAVLATGSELVMPGAKLHPGQVYNSNQAALAAAARDAGAEVVFEACVGDDAAQCAEALASAADQADLILTSGGVSQGAYEVVKQTLGKQVHFRSVAMQPGGPQGFGTVNDTPILTFPGNPVSAMVSFVVFARGALERASGWPVRGPRPAVMGEPGVSVAGKRQFLRGIFLPDAAIATVGGPGSHLVASMARADVLIDVPAHMERWDAGAELEVWEL